MKEYICQDCKDQFDEPAFEYGDTYEFMGAGERVMEQVCPTCKGENFVKIADVLNKVESAIGYYDLDWYDLSDLMEDKIK